ncbi:sulfite exporter TauE/SafE family protein [Chitinilyticum piscinae]|uniref:Probable membrane transporter protein n=1 Tax=Chitinilyticum piscinae TaxID=2866724 RepID=A0A8J7G204_9NEIS|nr:sulfite exporter TauE/SafE family protein [Chitinilyticum piscinae]MBE9609923.1 sulfite exporter TauE/SafE family protein [Chitinilyticum piscinae]
MEYAYIIAGFAVSFIVGMTGVGGGSLMTPLLLWMGVTPATAVGTDLLYAAITKSSGVVAHQRNRNIDWRITGWLALGSVPAAAITVVTLHFLHADTKFVNLIIKLSLGIALLLTAAALVFKKALLALAQRHAADWLNLPQRKLNAATCVVGVVLGVIVTLSSIGAGALGTLALFLLYPLLQTNRLVGTEIAHAVPLTLVAGLGHAGLGNIDWVLLGTLLIGSIPGIYLGSQLTGRIPDKVLRPALATMLVVVGVTLVKPAFAALL